MLRQVARAGDAAWVEDPCGAYLRKLPADAGLVPVPIDVDSHGMDVAQALRSAPRARLAIVSPTHQYPTGVTLSLERRHALVDWSETTGAWILENEIDGDYRYTSRPLPPLFSLSRSAAGVLLRQPQQAAGAGPAD